MKSIIKSVVSGQLVPLNKVNDESFSQELLGKGFAIEPSDDTVYAPFDGVVKSIFPSKHAILLESHLGIELLIHIGLDTVKLNGKFFHSHVKENQEITMADPLMTFDRKELIKEGYDTIIPVIILNSDKLISDHFVKEFGEVKANEDVWVVEFEKENSSVGQDKSQKNLEDQIIKYLGGEKNIENMFHCATRLRVSVKDMDQAHQGELKKLNGVLGVVESMGGLQIIIGNHVGDLYKKIRNKYEIGSAKKESSDKVTQDQNMLARIGNSVLNTLSAIVGPVIPIIMTSGLLQALIVVLKMIGISESNPSLHILETASNVAFYFLPIFLAYTSALRFKVSPVLAIFFGGLLLHPNILALAESQEVVRFLLIPLKAVNYSSSFIPIILTVWALSYIEKVVGKLIPDSLNFVLKPLIVVLIMLPITLLITAPFGAIVGDGLAHFMLALNDKATWLTVLIVSMLSPVLVLTGSHIALIPLVINSFETIGYDSFLFVAFIGLNFSQFAVSLAVFLKTKNANLKQASLSSAITAFLSGVTEPALYGISLRLKRPMIATFIGCLANGIYCAVTGVKVFSFGAPSFLTLPIFMNTDGTNTNFFLAIGAIAVTIIVTFVATWMLGFDDSEYASEGEK